MIESAIVISVAIFGAIVGSFLNVVIWRLPRGESLGGRSHCPRCNSVLQPQNLVPVFSYLLQRRRCAHCKEKISWRYPLIELICGVLFGAAAWYIFQDGRISALAWLELIRLVFIISILIPVFVIDLEHYLILDAIIFPASAIVLVLNIILDLSKHVSLISVSSHTLSGLIAATIAAGFFYLIWLISHGKWMGFGDVKLNLFLGLALGVIGVGVTLFVAFMLGAILGTALIFVGAKQLQSRLPFGTFLSLAALIALFWGPAIARWYGGLIGLH